MKALHRDEAGITLAELLVGSALAVVTLAIIVVWIVTTSRVDGDQEADFAVLNEMRAAREQIVKELRFADGTVPTITPNTVSVWIDLNANGTGPDFPGEQVTWQITGSQLVRFTDGNPATSRVWLDSVVDSASQLSLTDGVATVELATSIPRGVTSVVRTTKGKVSLRNAQP